MNRRNKPSHCNCIGEELLLLNRRAELEITNHAYLAGVDVGERGAPSAVAEAVLHDGGAEQHEHRPASEHPPIRTPWFGLIPWSSSSAPQAPLDLPCSLSAAMPMLPA
jgi:hypothetical protein